MPTIKQVADQARVSVATVSRVINKTGYVSLDLQERVTAAMRDLNYQPSALARSLRRQETQTIGLLVPQIDHPFFGTLSFAIEKTLFADRYRMLLCSAEENLEKEDIYVEMLLRQRVDGVIFVPTGHSASNLRRLIEQKVPVVLVDRDLPGLQLSRVLADNRRGAYEGVRHLLDLGHRVIGIVGGPVYSPPMVTRIAGARQALGEMGLDSSPEVMVSSPHQQFEMGYNALRELLKHKPRPTAIFALTDVMAIGVLHAAAEHGLTVPHDLSVMGFDDVPMAAYSLPALTTIAQPIYRMGEVAVQILLRQILGDHPPIENVLLETQLIVRKSTAPISS
jgi:LacI family transcriptional regulator